MDLIDLITRKQFVGNEFLMWLWFHSEEDDGRFALDDGSVELYFDDQLVLEAHLAEAEQSRLKGGAPAYSPEAHKALQLGKRVRSAKLRIVKDEREWLFSINADTFAMSGVKLPAVLSQEEDDQFYERMYLIEELEVVWMGLYGQFVRLRIDAEAWESELNAIRTWIQAPTADEVKA